MMKDIGIIGISLAIANKEKAMVKNLSPNKSRTFPGSLVQLYLRAKYPSNKSLAQAYTNSTIERKFSSSRNAIQTNIKPAIARLILIS